MINHPTDDRGHKNALLELSSIFTPDILGRVHGVNWDENQVSFADPIE